MFNKHKAMWEWLMQYPELYSYLKANTVDDVAGEVSFVTSYGDKWEHRHIRNHGIKRYDFAVAMIRQHDTGTSEINLEEIFDVEKFMSWVDEQNEDGNFPDFGEECRVISVENLQNMPNLAGVDRDGAAAKYLFQCRVRYSV